MLYFNTAFAASMVPDGIVEFRTVSVEEASEMLQGEFANVANPTHAPTLSALSRKLGVNLTQAQGGRVLLSEDDACLVAQISGLPRETREFTDEEVAAATFSFRLVTLVSAS